MSSVEVSFEKLLLAIWQFYLPELGPSWFCLPVQILRFFPCSWLYHIQLLLVWKAYPHHSPWIIIPFA